MRHIDCFGSACFDDISTSKIGDIDRYLDKFIAGASNGFLLAIRGYCESWKYPYVADHDYVPAKELLWQVLIGTEEVGIHINSIVCDQGRYLSYWHTGCGNDK